MHAPAADPRASPAQLWLRLFLPFAAGYFLSYLLRNVNAVIAPELTRELGVSAADLGLLTSAYLLTFGAFQLPLGVLLDRYGSRRVESALLLVAALGSAGFAFGTSLAELALARAAIGLGVCACLMAAFKAFAVWFPVQRLPSLNAAVMVAGGLGALAATVPLAWAVPLLGRRNVFLALSALAALAALAVFTTPERRSGAEVAPLTRQLREFARILGSRAFWRYAPMSAASLGGFVALQGLWAVPWLIEAGGLTRDVAASYLLLTTLGMVGGFLATALFIGRLQQHGVPPGRVMIAGYLAGLAALLAIAGGAGTWRPLWCVLGAAFAVGNLAYAELTGRFSPALAGRVNTALNLATFVGAFVLQWTYGVLLDAVAAAGWTPADGHRAALLALVVLQAACVAWYFGFAKAARPLPRFAASGAGVDESDAGAVR